MLKKIPDLHKKIVYILICLALVFTAIQTILAVRFYEPEVYLYAHGTVLGDIFNISLALFVAAALVLFTLLKTDRYPDSLAKVSVATRVFSLLSGAALLGCGINSMNIYLQKKSNVLYMAEKQDTFIMWSAISAFVACIYFVLVTFLADKMPKAKIWVGCVTIAWHIFYILSVYFDMTNPLNNPMRLINEFALVGAMMYLTVEIRYLAEIPKKGFYISASAIAFTLLMASSVSNIALSFRTSADANILCYIYQLTMAGYILTRLITQLNHKEKIEEKETVAS